MLNISILKVDSFKSNNFFYRLEFRQMLKLMLINQSLRLWWVVFIVCYLYIFTSHLFTDGYNFLKWNEGEKIENKTITMSLLVTFLKQSFKQCSVFSKKRIFSHIGFIIPVPTKNVYGIQSLTITDINNKMICTNNLYMPSITFFIPDGRFVFSYY